MLSAFRVRTQILVAALIIASMSLTGCAQVLHARQQALASAVTPGSGAENAMVAGINAYRNAHGLPSLAPHMVLIAKARSWAANMANGGCGLGGGGVPNICHSDLTSGITVSWSRLEENVGMISPRTNVGGMEGAFEHSPPHSENMLNGDIRYIGVGVAYVGDYMYVAEEFMA